MQPAFDPYYRWLGIGPEEQPPNYYRLLGLRPFEASPDVIETAADRQMRHVHTFKVGQYSEQSQSLLNEIAAARLCLLAPARKADYDAMLRAASPAPPPPLPPPAARAPIAAAMSHAVAVAEAAPPAPLINTQRSTRGQAYRNRRSLAHSGWMMLAVGLAAIGLFATAAWLVWQLQPIAPQLPAVANQTLAEGQTLSLKLPPAPPHKPGELVFDVLNGSPTGVQLDRANGDLTWTPEERHGPGTHRIGVRCSVAGSPHLFDEASFEVVVTEVHQPPQLEPVELKPTGNGAFSARLLGKDLDSPRGKLAYSLEIVPSPAGAPSLNSQSGQVFWRPGPADLGKTFHLTFRVAKAGQPQMVSEQTIKVEVPAGTGPAPVP